VVKKVCGKLGDNEIESMQNMMSMAVYSMLSDIFNIDVEYISQDSDLQNDLGMTETIKQNINSAVINTFDNLHLDFSQIKTVQDVVNQIIQSKMTGILSEQSG
jgi:acyl carrier protein